MIRVRVVMVTAAACVLLLAACAGGPKPAEQGPMVTVEPGAKLATLKTVSFSPTLVKYQSSLVIHNNADVDLNLDRIDWSVDLCDAELFTDVSKNLKRTRAGGDLVVPFNFQVATSDIADQGFDLYSEQELRVTVRGEVSPARRCGLDPVPFTATLSVPLPRVPDVTYLGSDGDPLTDKWRLHFTVTNRSSFPITLASVKTFVELNNEKYSLVHTKGVTDLAPGVATPVDLQMENSPAQALSMVLNLATNRNLRMNLTGQITCTSPYGQILVPLDLEEALTGG